MSSSTQSRAAPTGTPETLVHHILERVFDFRAPRQKNSGTHLSLDPSSGGIPEISSDGTLVFQSKNLKNKPGRPKILFFASPNIYKQRSQVLSYCMGFQAYSYDEHGTLVDATAHVTLAGNAFIPFTPPEKYADVCETLSTKTHVGTGDPISANEILFIDEAFLEKLTFRFNDIEANWGQGSPSTRYITSENFLTLNISAEDTSKIQYLWFLQTDKSPFTSSSFHSFLSSFPFEFMTSLKSIAFSGAETQICIDVLTSLPKKTRDQLLHLSIINNTRVPPSGSSKPLDSTIFPRNIERLTLKGNVPLSLTEPLENLRYFNVNNFDVIDTSAYERVIETAPQLIYVELILKKAGLMLRVFPSKCSAITAINLDINDHMPNLKFASFYSLPLSKLTHRSFQGLGLYSGKMPKTPVRTKKTFIFTNQVPDDFNEDITLNLYTETIHFFITLELPLQDQEKLKATLKSLASETKIKTVSISPQGAGFRADLLHFIAALNQTAPGKFYLKDHTTADSAQNSIKAKNPLEFDPAIMHSAESKPVFEGWGGEIIGPQNHLEQFCELSLCSNPTGYSTLITPITIETGPAIRALPEDTRVKTPHHYQGRIALSLEAGIPHLLPGLPNGRMKAIKLPPHCSLHQGLNTLQYFLRSTMTQECVLEFLIEAELPIFDNAPPKASPAAPKALPNFHELSLEGTSRGYQLRTPLRFPLGFAPQEKIMALANWITRFEEKTAKASKSEFNDDFISYFNAMLERKKGRCTERTVLFNVLFSLLQVEYPEDFSDVQCYYTQNMVHAMPVLILPTEGDPLRQKMLCLDLGGADDALHVNLTERLSGPTIEKEVSSVAPELLSDFLTRLYPSEKTYVLNDSTLGLDLNLDFTPESHKPKNACLKLKDSKALTQSLKIFELKTEAQKNSELPSRPNYAISAFSSGLEPYAGAGRPSAKIIPSPEAPLIFIANSLASLREKIYVRNPADPKDPKFYLENSPFKEFCESPRSHKILIISEKLFLEANGVSAYYPLLDNTRRINDITIPSEVQLVVLMQDGNLKKFREDFLSRFQVHGYLTIPEPATLDTDIGAETGAGSSSSRHPHSRPRRDVSCTPSLILNTEEPSELEQKTALRITTENIHTLFEHLEITPAGIMQHPGLLPANRGPLMIQSGLPSTAQQKLIEAQTQARAEGKDFPKIFEVRDFPATDYLIIKSMTQANIPQNMRTIIQKVIERSPVSSGLVTLALPELGNPFVKNLPDPTTSETRAIFTELKERLTQTYQTIILYGKLTGELKANLASIATGKFFLAGEEINVGEGTRVIILAQDKHNEILAGESEEEPTEINKFCSIKENFLDPHPDLRPWQERLRAWEKGEDPCLKLTSFDLMNPDSRSPLRDIVNSAFTGQIMVSGKIKDLRSSGQTIQVSGAFMPSVTRKLGQAFGAYENIEPPLTHPIILDSSMSNESPEAPVISLGDEFRAYDCIFNGSPIFLTDSRRKLLHALDSWLGQKSTNSDHPLFLVEGASGIGKSAILRHYLDHSDYKDHLTILSPSENLIKELEQANRDGKIVFIDELNTLRMDQLEAIEALVRSRPHLRMIGTQNPISFTGRAKLSKALLNHSIQFNLSQYDAIELQGICEGHRIPPAIADALIKKFQKDQFETRLTFRDFLSGIKFISGKYFPASSTEESIVPSIVSGLLDGDFGGSSSSARPHPLVGQRLATLKRESSLLLPKSLSPKEKRQKPDDAHESISSGP
jgi:hypothetical protein